MITVLSPAKKLSKECNAHDVVSTFPSFLDDSKELVSILKRSQPGDLQDLMGISENLSILNWERYQNWKLPFNKSESRQAVFTFQGDTYNGLNVESLNEKEISFAQDHTRILSGLYGVLKPLDLMMPYRLEMGTKFSINGNKNLYDFWKSKVTNQLKSELAEDELIVNLASNEYFSVINSKKVSNKIISPQFKDYKNGNLKIISFYAKKARGLMSRFIIDNNVKSVNEILSFDSGGYSYSKKDTTDELKPVFIR